MGPNKYALSPGGYILLSILHFLVPFWMQQKEVSLCIFLKIKLDALTQKNEF